MSHPHHSGSRRWSTKFRWQVGGILAITLAVIGAGFLLTSRTEVTVRVAAVNSPPFQIVSPEGKPGGAIFELLEMAAAQAEIRLVWVPVQESPESALTGKPKVDVYPLMEVRSNRKNVIHSTDAYARAE